MFHNMRPDVCPIFPDGEAGAVVYGWSFMVYPVIHDSVTQIPRF